MALYETKVVGFIIVCMYFDAFFGSFTAQAENPWYFHNMGTMHYTASFTTRNEQDSDILCIRLNIDGIGFNAWSYNTKHNLKQWQTG